jgi:thiol:disulfide interchange protein
MRHRTLALALLAAAFSTVATALAAAGDPNVKASLVAETHGFQPGKDLVVALRLEQDPGWHTYWQDPGDAGLATDVSWSLPKGVTAGPLLWPKPQVFKDPGGLVGYGYEGHSMVLAVIHVPDNYRGDELSIKAQANWLACKDVCIPGNAGVSLVLARLDPNPPSASAPRFEAIWPSLGQIPEGYKGSVKPGKPLRHGLRVSESQLDNFEQAPIQRPDTPAPPAATAGAQAGLAWMLLLAFAGGLLLNLMPCVLPVLSLKALSLVGASQQSRGRALALAGAYAAGVLLSFWTLAVLVLALKQGGAAVGWGFQFQQPAFVLAMAGLMLAFSLNLFGVFEIWLPGGATNTLSQVGRAPGLPGAVGQGLVMTLLATPCTAPFLGPALGFAFASGPIQLLLVFTAVAAGLAAPYVLLAAIPGAKSWLPKPGNWMLRFKEAMGFLLMATLVWLLWLLGKQVGVDGQAWALAWLLLLALACWIWGRFGGPERSFGARSALATLLFAMLFAGGVWMWPQALSGQAPDGAVVRGDSATGWEPWSEARVAELRAAGTPVFVDFGADWCWTCKVNERGTLANGGVLKAFNDLGVAKLKADWTHSDPAITAALRAQGRSGVPMYVFYPSHGEAHVLPELITPGMVLDALAQK